MGIFTRKEIAKVLYLGVHTGMESRTLSTDNFGIYSFLVEYTDGTREIKEVDARRATESGLINYIPMY